MKNTTSLKETHTQDASDALQATITHVQTYLAMALDESNSALLRQSSIELAQAELPVLVEAISHNENLQIDQINALIQETETYQKKITLLTTQNMNLNEDSERQQELNAKANQRQLEQNTRFKELTVDINKLRTEISRTKEQSLVHEEENKRLTKVTAELTAKLKALQGLKKERDELKSLDPKNLKAKNVKLAEENKKMTVQLKSTLKLQQKNKELEAFKENYIDKKFTKTLIERIDSDDGVYFSLLRNNYGLNLQSQENGISLLPDMQYHLILRSTIGIDLVLAVTSMGVAIIPKSTEIERYWEPRMMEAIHEAIMIEIEQSHPEYHAMIIATKHYNVANLNLTERQRDILDSCDINTVFRVCYKSHENFRKELNANRNEDSQVSVQEAQELRLSIERQFTRLMKNGKIAISVE